MAPVTPGQAIVHATAIADTVVRWRSAIARTVPYPLDRAVYRRRNLIERLFCRLKNWRRLATRYDHLARNYIAALALVSVVIEWI